MEHLHGSRYALPSAPGPAATVADVLRQEWGKILFSSLAVSVVFGAVTIESALNPGSAWTAIFAGLPTGVLSTLLISPDAVPPFMSHYSKTTAVLLTVVLLFAFALCRFDIVREYSRWFLFLFIGAWAALSYVVNFWFK